MCCRNVLCFICALSSQHWRKSFFIVNNFIMSVRYSTVFCMAEFTIQTGTNKIPLYFFTNIDPTCNKPIITLLHIPYYKIRTSVIPARPSLHSCHTSWPQYFTTRTAMQGNNWLIFCYLACFVLAGPWQNKNMN